jgi:hypothetical protein
MTKERLDSDPVVAEYFKANFPDAFESTDETGETLEEAGLRTVYESLGMLDDDGPDYWEKKAMRQEKIVKYERNIRPIKTYLRNPERDTGTRNGRRLRYYEKLIPGMLLGSDPTLKIFSSQKESKTFIMTPWNELQREIDLFHHNFDCRVYDLTIYDRPGDESQGSTHRVTPRNVNKHPVWSTVYCANFVRYHAGRSIKIPVRYINQEESATLRRDGFIIPITRHLECYVEEGADIPEYIDIECSGLQLKQVVRLDRAILPDGVRFSPRVLAKKTTDLTIGVVFGGRGSGDDQEAADASKSAEQAKTAEKKTEKKKEEASD